MKRLAGYFNLIENGINYEKDGEIRNLKVNGIYMNNSGEVIIDCLITDEESIYNKSFNLRDFNSEVQSWDDIH